MNNPLVSVIVPCYKQAHFLPETLNAVKNTSFEELKILLKDKIKGRYDNIIKKDPKQIFHKDGWDNRLNRY